MILALAFLMGLATFGMLTQRTLLGVLVNIQALFLGVILALALLASDPIAERARNLALLVLVFSQIQALLGLGFAVRMHYLRARATMDDLTTMRH